MAKLYRRGATWWISWSREERESARTKDKQAAELVFRRRERERADPVHAAAQAATVESCVNAYLAGLRARGRAEQTTVYYRRKLGHFVRVLGAGTPLADVTARELERYASERAEEETSPVTIGKELGAFRSALRLARRRGEYHLDPVLVVPEGFSGTSPPRETWLTEEQATRLLAVLPPHRARHVALFLATGMRLAESYRARREHVSGARVHIIGTKTDRATRDIEVPDYARPLLEQAVAGVKSGILVQHWHEGSRARDLAAACVRANVPRVSANDLRRTAAHWLRQRGVEASLVAAWLGHADTRMVERVYGRMKGRELSDAIGNRLDAHAVRPVYAKPTETGHEVQATEEAEP